MLTTNASVKKTSSISWMTSREKKTIPGDTARSSSAASAPVPPIQRRASGITTGRAPSPKSAGTRRMPTSLRPNSVVETSAA